MSTENKELERLRQENKELKKLLKCAREEAVSKQEEAARLSATTTMRMLRKFCAKTGKPDPFERLRPMLPEDASGEESERMIISIDKVSYFLDSFFIKGWVFDRRTKSVPKVLIRDKAQILDTECRYYVRADVNQLLEIAEDTESGFTIGLRIRDVHHSPLLIEFETEYGYVQRTVPFMMTEEAREQYMDEHGEPMYASDIFAYNEWVTYQRVKQQELETERQEVFPSMPLISICIPLYLTNEDYFGELMDCILNQSYQNFELCLADGSPNDQCRKMVEPYLKDERIHYRHLEKNLGISGNTNAAVEMAGGEFIMLSDHDDTIEKNALYEIVKAINAHPDTDVVYTDEDKLIEEEQIYASPNFKPDYNPDLLCCNNYITHIIVIRSSIVREIGGEDSQYDGAQDYDLILKACEKARRIAHVPKVLYHWRAHLESTAGNPESKQYAIDAGRRAIEAHYSRVGINAEVTPSEHFGGYYSRYRIEGEPLISIIIPNKDMKEVLERAVTSIDRLSSYRNFELLIVENNSETKEIFAYYDALTRTHDNVRILHWDGAFNYAAINNFAVKEARGEYVLFLNNDIEVISPRWLEEMLGYCQRSDVGCVGARLYYPNDTIQHCGVIVGMGGIAGHLLYQIDKDDLFYGGRIANTQDVSAVTAACMMMPKELFEEVGGFEEQFAVAYNDIDLCLKVRDKNYLCVYASRAELYHHESLTRGSDEADVDDQKHARQMAEAALLKERWPQIFQNGDPYFNPNLDYDATEYVLKGTMPKHWGTKKG